MVQSYLESMLSMVVNDHQTDWNVHFPRVLFAYHTSIHDATGFSPFHITFGCSPTLPVYAMIGSLPQPNTKKLPAFLDALHCSLTSAYQPVRCQIQLAHHRNKQRYDKGKPYVPFTIGSGCMSLLWVLDIQRSSHHNGGDLTL